MLDAGKPRLMNSFLKFMAGFWKAAAPTVKLYLICFVMMIVVVFLAEVVLRFIH
jgi:hypothetical protein